MLGWVGESYESPRSNNMDEEERDSASSVGPNPMPSIAHRRTRTGDMSSIAPAPSGIGSVIGLNLNMPWLLRLQSRDAELRSWFGIDMGPQQPTLIDDFGCALRKRILLQGRIFLFEDYVSLSPEERKFLLTASLSPLNMINSGLAWIMPQICFNTNVFGYVKKKVIPISVS